MDSYEFLLIYLFFIEAKLLRYIPKKILFSPKRREGNKKKREKRQLYFSSTQFPLASLARAVRND